MRNEAAWIAAINLIDGNATEIEGETQHITSHHIAHTHTHWPPETESFSSIIIIILSKFFPVNRRESYGTIG